MCLQNIRAETAGTMKWHKGVLKSITLKSIVPLRSSSPTWFASSVANCAPLQLLE
jgi:hypothetical protein